MLPIDIERYVGRTFAPNEQAKAMDMLGHAKLADGLAAEPRLLRCALVASNGKLKGLRYQLGGLAYDYRDVILAGEYVRKKGEWVQIRDLSQPFADEA
jgi:hypothetical protein